MLAHELGHTFGMRHDGSGNSCNRIGFIMSSSRNPEGGQTKWSDCSKEKLQKFSKQCIYDVPQAKSGLIMEASPSSLPTAEQQCQLFLKDKTAKAIKDDPAMCQSLQCLSDELERSVSAGPALDGTECQTATSGPNIRPLCQAGECKELSEAVPRVSGPIRTEDEKDFSCKSGCLRRSLGFRPATGELCDEAGDCSLPEEQLSRARYAVDLCQKAYQSQDVLGSPAIHNAANERQACMIFCKSEEATLGTWKPIKNPDMTYYPLGTWCHYNKETGEHYYCQTGNRCQPRDNAIVRVQAEKKVLV